MIFKKALKVHLYHAHTIFNERDHLKWKNDNHLIWRHF